MSTPLESISVSNSELRAFKRCRRKWWGTYYLKLRKRFEGPGPLSIGNMVHHVLEMFYSLSEDEAMQFVDDGLWRIVLEKYVAARMVELEEAGGDAYIVEMQKDAELAAIMLEGYFEWLKEEGADALIAIQSAEEEVEEYIADIEGCRVTLRAKLDLRAVIQSTGERLFVDHKTVANLTDLPKTSHLDEQQLTYGLLERLRGQREPNLPRSVGGLLNMLRKVKRTARANPPFYGRFAVYHNDEEYRSMYLRVWGEVRDLIRVRRELDLGADHRVVAYPNPTRDCSWDCPFFAVCQMFDDGSDVATVIAEGYEVHDPYERYTELEKQ